MITVGGLRGITRRRERGDLQVLTHHRSKAPLGRGGGVWSVWRLYAVSRGGGGIVSPVARWAEPPRCTSTAHWAVLSPFVSFRRLTMNLCLEGLAGELCMWYRSLLGSAEGEDQRSNAVTLARGLQATPISSRLPRARRRLLGGRATRKASYCPKRPHGPFEERAEKRPWFLR